MKIEDYTLLYIKKKWMYQNMMFGTSSLYFFDNHC